MQLFDTHCHISLEQFDADRDAVIRRMLEAGVRRAIVVVDAVEDVEGAFSLAAAHDFLHVAVGVHPHNAKDYDARAEAALRAALGRPQVVTLGEIGLDYHYDFSPREAQRRAFERQLDIALELGLPVQLHIREAHGETMEIVRARSRSGRMPAGVMHCFTGSWEAAKTYLAAGLYISLSGAVTFKNAPKLAEVAKNVPADRLLIETDCPYMAPVPLRGRRNEPAFVAYTCLKIAEIRGEAVEDVARMTYENALRAFRIAEDGGMA